ncbi:MAG: hypothetical protein ACXW3Q_11620 [Rhodoplanes sp.]|jgi:hypothetical protein
MMKCLNTALAIVARSTVALPAATASRTGALAVALLLSGLLVLSPVGGYAAGLDCPETGAGAVPDLLAGSQQIERMTTGNEVDLANEIKGLINRVQTEKPGISSDEIVNVLIAAYCPVVARMQASPADKWRLMRRFDAAVLRELTAATMPSGSLIIADVPLPPSVFRSLTNQADAAGQTPAQFMATILTGAAKR